MVSSSLIEHRNKGVRLTFVQTGRQGVERDLNESATEERACRIKYSRSVG